MSDLTILYQAVLVTGAIAAAAWTVRDLMRGQR